MATISVAGIGSGLDVNGILEQIVEAERAPTENRLNIKEANLQAELSAFGIIKGAVNSFQSSLGKLSSASLFNSTDVSVSDASVLSAVSSSIAQPGNYSVEVNSIAQSHTLASIAFDDLDDVIGTGTLNFSFGTTVYDPGTDFETGDDIYSPFNKNTERSDESVVIDNTNNTISGIRDAINDADIGVNASIVDDGSGYRLLITSELQGEDNSLEISVVDNDADNVDTAGLSLLAFNIGATNVEQTQAAQDAKITVNGLTVTRESNNLTGVIPGVTLNINKLTEVNSSVQVTVTNENVAEAKNNISNFVNSFNEMASTINGLTSFGGENGTNGVLLGDTTARNILQQTRRELGGLIENGGSFNSLSSIGITTNRDGTLSLDTDLLDSALADDFDSVAQLFYANGNPSDNEIIFQSSSDATREGDYQVSISSLATQGKFSADARPGPFMIGATNDSFSFQIDGVSTGLISITQADYTSAEELVNLAQEIENRINAASALQAEGINVAVEYTAGKFEISSSTYGEESTVKIVSPNNDLGFIASATSTAGTDVVGTIGGQVATGSGQSLTGSGAASGLVLEITGDSTGNRGSVTFSQGLASKLDSLFNQFQATDGQLSAKTESLTNQIESIAGERVDLLERVAEIEARFRRQFSSLDVLINQLNTTSTFLQQQLDALPGVTFNQN